MPKEPAVDAFVRTLVLGLGMGVRISRHLGRVDAGGYRDISWSIAADRDVACDEGRDSPRAEHDRLDRRRDIADAKCPDGPEFRGREVVALLNDPRPLRRRRRPDAVDLDVCCEREGGTGEALDAICRVEARETADHRDPWEMGQARPSEADDAVRQVRRQGTNRTTLERWGARWRRHLASSGFHIAKPGRDAVAGDDATVVRPGWRGPS